MKLRAPEGCSAVSHHGTEMVIGADGCVDTDDCTAAALIAHGFSELSTEEPEKRDKPSRAAEKVVDAIDGLNRPALFAFLKERGISVSLPVTNDELRALARQALAAAARDGEEA